MTAVLSSASVQDIAELRQLYFEVYGHGYPVPLGSDPVVMRRLITDGTAHWLTARAPVGGALVGSAVVLTEPGSRIGKLVGLAVHPGHRGGGLASRLTGAVCDEAFATGLLDSVYATVRLVTEGPQQVVVRNGFRPLGLLPNAVEVEGCETLALFARYADGVLERREPVLNVPERLSALLSAACRGVGIDHPRTRPAPWSGTTAVGAEPSEPLAAPPVADAEPIELIAAPAFVRRRFLELFPAADDRFFPLHTPNAVLVAADGRFEAYADLDPLAGSCALVAVHPRPSVVAGTLEAVIATVTRAGADYVETLLPLADTEALEVFLASGFVPSAVYPAMRRIDDRLHDYVVLSRTSRQIDFRTTAVSPLLQPYLGAYLSAWTTTYLPLHEVSR
ncbi:GNAT family N-acetyltransferase [Streptomyces broussonetiae]|uniref:GNAT family N-acetyltransferase n=1 Tax=Streptomyces broussonetiae TaxID=2686304 RepID=A0A6I6N6W0_9ACTN|nr:GNAT family N-acetyltransferase [Streptomyces broussonetiae]QHA08938.1 GNAT family N-acetyltransferase [Streptomyces broussonetiae]